MKMKNEGNTTYHVLTLNINIFTYNTDVMSPITHSPFGSSEIVIRRGLIRKF